MSDALAKQLFFAKQGIDYLEASTKEAIALDNRWLNARADQRDSCRKALLAIQQDHIRSLLISQQAMKNYKGKPRR